MKKTSTMALSMGKVKKEAYRAPKLTKFGKVKSLTKGTGSVEFDEDQSPLL